MTSGTQRIYRNLISQTTIESRGRLPTNVGMILGSKLISSHQFAFSN